MVYILAFNETLIGSGLVNFKPRIPTIRELTFSFTPPETLDGGGFKRKEVEISDKESEIQTLTDTPQLLLLEDILISDDKNKNDLGSLAITSYYDKTNIHSNKISNRDSVLAYLSFPDSQNDIFSVPNDYHDIISSTPIIKLSKPYSMSYTSNNFNSIYTSDDNYSPSQLKKLIRSNNYSETSTYSSHIPLYSPRRESSSMNYSELSYDKTLETYNFNFPVLSYTPSNIIEYKISKVNVLSFSLPVNFNIGIERIVQSPIESIHSQQKVQTYAFKVDINSISHNKSNYSEKFSDLDISGLQNTFEEMNYNVSLPYTIDSQKHENSSNQNISSLPQFSSINPDHVYVPIKNSGLNIIINQQDFTAYQDTSNIELNNQYLHSNINLGDFVTKPTKEVQFNYNFSDTDSPKPVEMLNYANNGKKFEYQSHDNLFDSVPLSEIVQEKTNDQFIQLYNGNIQNLNRETFTGNKLTDDLESLFYFEETDLTEEISTNSKEFFDPVPVDEEYREEKKKEIKNKTEKSDLQYEEKDEDVDSNKQSSEYLEKASTSMAYILGGSLFLTALLGLAPVALIKNIYETKVEKSKSIYEGTIDESITLQPQNEIENVNDIAENTIDSPFFKKGNEWSNYFQEVEKKFDIKASYFFLNMETDESYGYNEDEEVQPASTIKLGLMEAILYLDMIEESISLGDIIKRNDDLKPNRIKIEDKDEYTVLELVYASISKSDNYASNLLIEYIGKANLNKIMDLFGYEKTKFDGFFIEGGGYENNLSTARELAYIEKNLIQKKNLDDKHHKIAMEAMKLSEDLKYTINLENEAVYSSFKIGQTKNSFGSIYGQNGDSNFVSTLIFNTSKPTYNDDFQLTMDYGAPLNNEFIHTNRKIINDVSNISKFSIQNL